MYVCVLLMQAPHYVPKTNTSSHSHSLNLYFRLVGHPGGHSSQPPRRQHLSLGHEEGDILSRGEHSHRQDGGSLGQTRPS